MGRALWQGKRRHKRIIKRLKTEFSSEESSFRGTSSNLSESGLFLKTIKPLPVDTLVEVSIQLPDNTVSFFSKWRELFLLNPSFNSTGEISFKEVGETKSRSLDRYYSTGHDLDALWRQE